MNWYKLASIISIYRGENVSSQNRGKIIGYYSVDREFARQFTQTGQDKEVKERKIDLNAIYDARQEGKPLPSANNEADFENAMRRAAELGYSAFRLTEGPNQPDSIYIMDWRKAFHPNTFK